MSIKAVRRMASYLMKCGGTRVVMDSAHLEDIEKSITKDDVRALIRKGYVWASPKKGVPRTRGRMHADRLRAGRGRGAGKRRGTANARLNSKSVWMARVRSQRKLLKSLKQQGAVTEGYREAYNKIKGGAIKDKSHLMIFLKEKGYLNEKALKPKQQEPK